MFETRRFITLSEGKQIDMLRKVGLKIDKGIFTETYTVIKYKNAYMALKMKPYDILTNVCDRGINCLLDAGITQIWNLLIAANANNFSAAQIGVGDSDTAAVHTQTNLQGSNTDWHAMEANYPAVADQTITFQGQFGDGHAEWNWLECAVRQAGNGTTVLNRVVSDKGTKAAGEVWSAKEQITLS